MAVKTLGEIVKEARTAKGLSQAALAEAVEGLTASDVSKIERGEKAPTQAVLKKMAKPLGVTQATLLDAPTGTGKTSTAKTSSGKTSASKTSSSAKNSSSKKSSSKTSSSDLKLTATEKKLVEAYRKAGADTKKAAMNLLSGTATVTELAAVMLAGKTGTSGSTSSSSSKDSMSQMIESVLGKLMK